MGIVISSDVSTVMGPCMDRMVRVMMICESRVCVGLLYLEGLSYIRSVEVWSVVMYKYACT